MTRLGYFALCLLLARSADARSRDALNIEEATSRAQEPAAKCIFSVHVKGSDGPEVKDATLDQELYYKIGCEPKEGYCLRVSNCSVSTDETKQNPYLIIDGNGCTTEPSLFEHVQYENDYTAGIYNPYPIRFRGQKSAVQFQCTTTLVLLSADGKCERERCAWNEYSREANQPAATAEKQPKKRSN